MRLPINALRTRSAGLGLPLFILFAIVSLNTSSVHAQEAVTQHPFIAKADIKYETCIICHSAKKEGKHVHTAVPLGCEGCHKVVTEDQKTTITLVAAGGDLCARCHAAEQDQVVHFPYKAGQCLVCHSPHESDFPDQVRASADTLCLSCHGLDRPNVHINRAADLVTMLAGHQISYEEYQLAPKIKLDPSGVSGHPVPGHPVSGKDPRKQDATLSCLSCHSPHGSGADNLLPAGIKSREELCTQCHPRGT